MSLEIPITLDELETLSRKNAEGQYDPVFDGLERIIKAARLAHYFNACLERQEERERLHLVSCLEDYR